MAMVKNLLLALDLPMVVVILVDCRLLREGYAVVGACLALGYVCQFVFQYSSSERAYMVNEDMTFDVIVLMLGTDGANARDFLVVRL